MAQSRLEKIGTIYTRVSFLIKGGAMKKEDIPMWYSVYEAFPPKEEPRWDRVTLKIPIRQILYEEDTVRAKLHRQYKNLPVADLNKNSDSSLTWRFITMYEEARKGGESEEEAFKIALSHLSESQKEKVNTQQQKESLQLSAEYLIPD